MEVARNTQHSTLNTQYQFGRIGVLMGGPSCEREISLKSGKAVYEALINRGLDVAGIDITSDDYEENTRLIKLHKIDCAFLALHGSFGEDGQIQGLLDSINIPYTGSGAEASRLAMDKIASRKVLEARGLKAPAYKVLEKESFKADFKDEVDFPLPWVIKPAGCGSSMGLSIIDDFQGLRLAVDSAFNFDKRIIVEEYINGREVTVGILDDQALPAIEIITKKRFFDYEAKYKPGFTNYIVPAELPNDTAMELQRIAFSVHKLLGCFGCSRVDMILDDKNTAFVLELNSIPGLTATSLLPKAAKVAGIEFSELCIKLVKLAYERAQV